MRVGSKVLIIIDENNTARGIIIQVYRNGYDIQISTGAVVYIESEYVYPDVY